VTITIDLWSTLYALTVGLSGWGIYSVFTESPYWYPKKGPRKDYLKTHGDAFGCAVLALVPVANVIATIIILSVNGRFDRFSAWMEAPFYKVPNEAPTKEVQ